MLGAVLSHPVSGPLRCLLNSNTWVGTKLSKINLSRGPSFSDAGRTGLCSVKQERPQDLRLGGAGGHESGCRASIELMRAHRGASGCKRMQGSGLRGRWQQGWRKDRFEIQLVGKRRIWGVWKRRSSACQPGVGAGRYLR